MSDGENAAWMGMYSDCDDQVVCPHVVETSDDNDDEDDMSVDSDEQADNWCLGDRLDFRTGDGLWRTGRIVDCDSRQVTIESRPDGNFVFQKPFSKSIAVAESMVGPGPFRMTTLRYGDPVEVNVLGTGWKNGEVIGFGTGAQVLVCVICCENCPTNVKHEQVIDEGGEKLWFHRNVAKEIRPHSAARTKQTARRQGSSSTNVVTTRSRSKRTSSNSANSPFKPPAKSGGSGGDGEGPPRRPPRGGHAVDDGKNKKNTKKTKKRSKPEGECKESESRPPKRTRVVVDSSSDSDMDDCDFDLDSEMKECDKESVEFTSSISDIPTVFTPFVV